MFFLTIAVSEVLITVGSWPTNINAALKMKDLGITIV